MTIKHLVLIVITASLSLSAFAYQDDTRVLLRRPQLLFSGNEEGETKFLSDFAARANFGSFLDTDEFHTWRFGIGFDGVILSFGENALWRAGANFDAIADSQNKQFFFRLGQTHYEVFSAFEFKIDESVLYLGYRHRCRHAADRTFARIIMKTGPEAGFNGFFHLGPFEITTASAFLLYLTGQNDDLSHQHRMSLSNSIQAEIIPWESIGFFAGVGISAIWVTMSGHREYSVFTVPLNNELRFSPAASAGMNLRGDKGEFKAYVSYNSNLDAGFRDRAIQTHIVSLNGEIWF